MIRGQWVGSDRVGFRLGHIILLFFLTRSKFDLIIFKSKNLDLYSIRSDSCKIIKYLLIYFYIILNN
jgi:hypothetical protein